MEYFQIHLRNFFFKRITPLVIYLFLVHSTGSCFSQILVSGILCDSTAARVEYANVQVTAGKSYFLTSDSLGRFFQSIAAPGSVRIQVSQINFSPWDSTFMVNNDTTVVITLRSSLKNIKEIIISAGKRNDNNTILISNNDFSFKSKSLGETDLLGILQQKTGIAHSSEVSPGLNVRGMQQGNTGIFFGGTELFGINHILSIYPQFNSDAIGNVHLLKADFDPCYSGYLSSVMLIEPDHKLYSEFAGGAELGILNAKLTLNVPVVRDKISAKISLRRSYFDLIADAYNNRGKNVLPKYGFSEINTSLVWHTVKKGIFSLDFFNTADKIKFDDNDLSLFSRWKNYLVSGKWNVPLSARTNFELLAGYTRFNLNVIFTKLFDHAIQNDISQGNVSAKVTYRVTNTLKCDLGTDFKLSRLNLEASSADFGTVDSSPVTWKVPAENTALFENIQWFPARKLKFKAGSRLEIFHSDTTYMDLIPFISANYDLYGYTLNLSYSKQIQYKHLFIPTGINLPLNIWCPSQSDVPPEKASHYNISVSKTISDNFNLSVSAYYIDLKDLTEFLEGNYFTSLRFTTDLGHGYSKGLETGFTWKTRNIEIEGGVTISKSKRKFPLINNGVWFSPPFDIRHKADFNVLYRCGNKWVFTLSQFIQDGFVMTLPTSIFIHQTGDIAANSNYEIVPVYTTRYNFRMPLSHRMDLSASYSFNWSGSEAVIVFGIYNLYNYQNPYFIYFTPQVQDNSRIFLQSRKKSLLPMIPFVSFKLTF
ncbi:MAG: TonB-dependent receptor [Bacteroidales bacterium]|nr:TonB-dependent receptor [Bacteroidales bacterium]